MKLSRGHVQYHLGAGALALACAACQASEPSQELKTARDVYARASDGIAARVDPDSLEEAHEALRAAEAAHEESAGSRSERNYAYLAVRKSELAIANAREAAARQAQARAQQAQGARPFAEALAETRAELAARHRDLGQAVAAIIISQMQLHQLRAQSAADAQVVVSRTGVFFDPGKAELTPQARRQLDIVASELLKHPEQRTIIQGNADSRGNAEQNLELSKKRAEVVRDYLASRGVSAEALRAVGVGDRDPVASNETPDGRASNRRVEIATALANDERQNVRGTDEDSEGDPEMGGDDEGAPERDPETDGDAEGAPKGEDPEPEEWQREELEPAPREPPSL